MSAGKVIDGAREAVEFSRVERAIFDWIRDDGTIVVKMHVTPRMVRQLAAKITGAVVHEKEGPE